jgi:hypothetical protein
MGAVGLFADVVSSSLAWPELLALINSRLASAGFKLVETRPY